MTASRSSILLTGFGAFPGVEENATAALVPELAVAARARFPQHHVVDEVLPVEWARAPQRLQQLLAESDARLALHFGVSREAHGFQIELTGRNVCEARHDAVGTLPQAAALITGGPDVLASTFPAGRILARLREAGIPCAPSESAGTYLCNALLYHSLVNARTRPFQTGFVHLPASLTPASGADCILSWQDAIAGGIEIIAACLEMETIA